MEKSKNPGISEIKPLLRFWESKIQEYSKKHWYSLHFEEKVEKWEIWKPLLKTIIKPVVFEVSGAWEICAQTPLQNLRKNTLFAFQGSPRVD